MPGNLRKFVETLLGSQRDLSFSTIGPDGYPQSVLASYANDGMDIVVGAKAQGQQVRNLASNAKSCITVVSSEADWGSIRGVTLRGRAAVLAIDSPDRRRAVDLMRRKYPESGRLLQADAASLAMIRFDPVAAMVLDHWDGIGFCELVDLTLDA